MNEWNEKKWTNAGYSIINNEMIYDFRGFRYFSLISFFLMIILWPEKVDWLTDCDCVQNIRVCGQKNGKNTAAQIIAIIIIIAIINGCRPLVYKYNNWGFFIYLFIQLSNKPDNTYTYWWAKNRETLIKTRGQLARLSSAAVFEVFTPEIK